MVRLSNGGLKTGLKKPLQGPKCPVFEWSAKSCDFTIRILYTHTVWYSNESSIQTVTVIVYYNAEFSKILWILHSFLVYKSKKQKVDFSIQKSLQPVSIP